MDKVIYVSFYGVDSMNRPIFKAHGSKKLYGSLDILFAVYASEEDVLAKVEERDLVFFGWRFNCEPNGGKVSDSIKIVLRRDKPL